MSVDIQEVAEFVGQSNPDDPSLVAFLAAAVALIDEYLGLSGKQRCPDEIYDLAVRLVVRRLFDLRNAGNGVVQYSPNGESTLLPADPIKPAIPLLRRYKPIGGVG